MDDDFHGSYRPEQVRFLLKPLPQMEFTAVRDKEALIQNGARHYGEMLSPEALPSPEYLRLYRQACAANNRRVARDCLALMRTLLEKHRRPPVLLSLARAGTPIGVILQALLSQHYGVQVSHYSLSIIRDRGIDVRALDVVLAQHEASDCVFIDGWSSKGVIAHELKKAVAAYNGARGSALSADLYVLSDLGGQAAIAASHGDYLIPNALLNATVSGLISRSVLPAAGSGEDLHGCVFYENWRPWDESQAFVSDVLAWAQREALPAPATAPPAGRLAGLLSALQSSHGLRRPEQIKIGLGEATRALLRRDAERLLLRDLTRPEVAHLCRLAEEKGIAVEEMPALPCHAVALIRVLQP